MDNVFASKLDLLTYRIWTYVLLPIFFLFSLYIVFSETKVDLGGVVFSFVILLQIIGLHLKFKIAFWTNFIFIAILLFGLSFLRDSRALWNGDILIAAMAGGIWGFVFFRLFARWYKTKPIFYVVNISDINWNLYSDESEKETNTYLDKKNVWGLIGGIVVVAICYNVNKQETQPHSIKHQSNTSSQVQQSTQFDPRAWAFADEETANKMLENYRASRQQQPVLDPKKWVFQESQNPKVVENSKSYSYDHQRNTKAQSQSEPIDNVAFNCTLSDGREIYVIRRGYDYSYIAWNGIKDKVELRFSNNINQIINNSLSHKNGATLVMQNGTYQYRIANQGSKTTIFVYNKDKGVSTHYCNDESVRWYSNNLPRLANNVGSPSHRMYCKQIINEGLYLVKMAKMCPYELSGINITVEHIALFFDAESCGYLWHEAKQSQRTMMNSLSKKLNLSIDKKSKKLGAKFCEKESGYAKKMSERYIDFFSNN
ncbi:hypothetical protein ACLQ91_02130 [Avibacterium endocarditidis]|uniref:hypothetical protein n=1 Tax=Avibacterium endocarditidis TaxID=380674 RepID=UPI0039FCEEC7